VAASKIYLKGGPCDGKTVSADEIQGGLVAFIACGGGFYTVNNAGKRHNGELIFDYAGKKQPGPPGGGGVNAAKAHGGWAGVRKSVNHHMPASLRASQRSTRAALHTLGRAHRVRF
jgi:hypothetical protein